MKTISLEPTLRTTPETFTTMDENEEQQVAHLKTILFESDNTLSDSSITTQERLVSRGQTGQSDPKPTIKKKTLSEWLTKYFLIKDEDIYQRRGYDALQYLVFQRFLIYFLFSLTVVCMFIILPLNVYAGKLNEKPNTYYKRTTILNVKNESPLIYVHALMSIFVVAMVLSSHSSTLNKSYFEFRILLGNISNEEL